MTALQEVTQAEIVLNALSEVHQLDDVQEIVDRICQLVAEVGPYRLALLSLYFGDDVYIGLEGGNEEMRRRFLASAREATPEGRDERRAAIWEHRIPGTNICFIPAESGVPVGTAFHPSEDVEGQEWRPDDRLMVFVRGADSEVRGVLSLDRPVDGKRPDPDNLGLLEAVDRFITLMGVVIHNQHLAAKLGESEERYAAVVEQGHDGILIERDGEVLFTNQRLGEMVGADPARLVGQPVASILRQDERASLPGEKDGQLLREDGRTVDVALRTGTIRFAGSNATLIAVADITERKRIFTQLVRAQKMESVGTLASGIAHDFNNLLGGIMGYASLLKTCVDTEARAFRYVDSIEKAADRAADVTRQLLGVVRDKEVSVAPFAVGRVLEEIATLVEETLDPSIKTTVHCASDVPQVLGDESQLHQVLLNVCLNARDAMPDGGRLTLEAAASMAGGSGVRITVRDDGFGMDADTLARVFDPFFTTKEGGRGSGLGLYMSYRVIERHGGTIDITSRPGRGTSVEILLPAATAVVSGGMAATNNVLDGDGWVLLVDDEQLMLDVGGEMLRGLGFQVAKASDGRAAVDAVRDAAGSFRCVILDIAMPIMDGWEAARVIRELDPDLPILLSSGHDVDAALGDTHGLDGARCLKKPYTVDELRAALSDVMSDVS